MQRDYSFCLKESNTVWMALQSRDDDHATRARAVFANPGQLRRRERYQQNTPI
jgi:hypothetical protein